MGNLIDMKGGSRNKEAAQYAIKGTALATLLQLCRETGQFPDPAPIETMPLPIYHVDTLKTLAGGGLILDEDFIKNFPIHFSLIALSIVYSKSAKAEMDVLIKAAQGVDQVKEAIDNIQNSPLSRCGYGLTQYTMNSIMMKFFTPETYAGERLILILNPLTEKVELWAGQPLHIDKPAEDTTGEPSESPGPAPAEEK